MYNLLCNGGPHILANIHLSRGCGKGVSLIFTNDVICKEEGITFNSFGNHGCFPQCGQGRVQLKMRVKLSIVRKKAWQSQFPAVGKILKCYEKVSPCPHVILNADTLCI